MDDPEPPFAEWKPGTVAASQVRAEVAVPASRFTVEGEIAAWGDLGRAAKRRTGWRRIAAYALAITALAPFAIGIVMGLVSVVRGL